MEAGRYFNTEEVGKDVVAMQVMLFAHVADIALRQTFYQPLLEKALNGNIIDKETYVNFVLETERLKDPDFWDTIDKRLPQIRKKYGLTDRYLFRPL